MGVFWPVYIRNPFWRQRAWCRLKWLVGITPDVYVDDRNRLVIAGLCQRDSFYGWRRVVLKDPCVYCHGITDTIEHVQPLSSLRKLGAASPGWSNLVGACERCNSGRGDIPLLQWLHWQHARSRQPKKQRLRTFLREQRAKLRDAKWTFVNEEAKKTLGNGRNKKAS